MKLLNRKTPDTSINTSTQWKTFPTVYCTPCNVDWLIREDSTKPGIPISHTLLREIKET